MIAPYLMTIDISSVTEPLGTAIGDVSSAALAMVAQALPLAVPVFAAFVVIGVALRIVRKLIGK